MQPAPVALLEDKSLAQLLAGGEGQFLEYKSSLMWDYRKQAVNKELYEPVMKNLADPSKLGHGIAAAFTATIYGIGAANLLLLPVGNKLKTLVNAQVLEREMMIEGLIAIAQGENPRNIEARLNGYVH